MCRPRKAPAAVQDVASIVSRPSRAIGGRSGAFAKPWKCGTRSIRIEATRNDSYTSIGGRRAGPGVDRAAAIQSDRWAQPKLSPSPGAAGRDRLGSKRRGTIPTRASAVAARDLASTAQRPSRAIGGRSRSFRQALERLDAIG